MVDEPIVAERGLLTVPDEVWALAVRRAEVIGPLAKVDVIGGAAVEAAAAQLGISQRQVYVLRRRWRAGEGGRVRPDPRAAPAAGRCRCRPRTGRRCGRSPALRPAGAAHAHVLGRPRRRAATARKLSHESGPGHPGGWLLGRPGSGTGPRRTPIGSHGRAGPGDARSPGADRTSSKQAMTAPALWWLLATTGVAGHRIWTPSRLRPGPCAALMRVRQVEGHLLRACQRAGIREPMQDGVVPRERPDLAVAASCPAKRPTIR
jgi:hypothetical protein